MSGLPFSFSYMNMNTLHNFLCFFQNYSKCVFAENLVYFINIFTNIEHNMFSLHIVGFSALFV